MADVPNVNLFLGYVECLEGKPPNDDYVKQYRDQRKFYSCGKDNDYVKYVNTGSKEATDIVAYSGNSEKSHGVFNQDGLMSSEAIKKLRTNLRETKSVIWHGVISFTEEFGNRYCDNYEKAYKLMKTELPKFFYNAGLNPKNIEWFAGLHENTDNKHIHISFFEKAPLRYRRGCRNRVFSNGVLPQRAIDTAKVSIETKLLDLSSGIYQNRKTMTDRLNREMQLGVFMKKISSLLLVIPFEGRLAYDSAEIAPFKPQIDMVIHAIIKSDGEMKKKFNTFESLLTKRDNEMKMAYDKINVDCSDKLLRDKTMNDLYRRLGNVILKSIKVIRYEQRKEEFETKRRFALKRIEKKKRQILLKRCQMLTQQVNDEIMNSFKEFMQKLEEVHYKRLKEEGLLD